MFRKAVESCRVGGVQRLDQKITEADATWRICSSHLCRIELPTAPSFGHWVDIRPMAILAAPGLKHQGLPSNRCLATQIWPGQLVEIPQSRWRAAAMSSPRFSHLAACKLLHAEASCEAMGRPKLVRGRFISASPGTIFGSPVDLDVANQPEGHLAGCYPYQSTAAVEPRLLLQTCDPTTGGLQNHRPTTAAHAGHRGHSAKDSRTLGSWTA